MAALLLKDFYTLTRQSRIFLLIIIVFAVAQNSAMSTIALVYAALLPVTALSYDERAKWDTLAAMMPYSTSAIVMSKYLMGYISLAVTVLLGLAAQAVVCAVKGAAFQLQAVIPSLLIGCVALVMLAIELPMMFRFGVEKGRIAFVVMVGLAAVAIAFAGDELANLIRSGNANAGAVTLVVFASPVLANIVSIPASIGLYKRKIALGK